MLQRIAGRHRKTIVRGKALQYNDLNVAGFSDADREPVKRPANLSDLRFANHDPAWLLTFAPRRPRQYFINGPSFERALLPSRRLQRDSPRASPDGHCIWPPGLRLPDRLD